MRWGQVQLEVLPEWRKLPVVDWFPLPRLWLLRMAEELTLPFKDYLIRSWRPIKCCLTYKT